MGVSKTNQHIQIKIKMPNHSQDPPVYSKAPNEDLEEVDVLCTWKSRKSNNIWNMGVSMTSEHIKSKINMPNISQKPPVSSKASNKDLKGMDVLCTFKIKIESQNLNYGCTND